MKYIVYDIKWDTDGYKTDLPDRVEISEENLLYEHEDKNLKLDDDELLDRISDYLSDQFGYCHDGFMIARE